jgi:hypothetical protein
VPSMWREASAQFTQALNVRFPPRSGHKRKVAESVSGYCTAVRLKVCPNIVRRY